MANRIISEFPLTFNKLNKADNFSVHGQFPLSTPNPKSGIEQSAYDDLIFSLSNSYENKRERQVLEWERRRLGNFRNAA